jgi:hypothetical protein
MKLAPAVAYSSTQQSNIERETYQAHCRNIADIIASVAVDARTAAIEDYLTYSNASTVPYEPEEGGGKKPPKK